MNPTIVAPGGSYSKAMVAAMNGADEVYVGVPFTSLRMRQNKVKTFDELKKTIADLHGLGKKALLTMNIFPRNSDIKIFESVVEQISDTQADAVIFSDLGTYNIIKKYLPNTKLHLSTQTSTLNYAAVKFWADLGINRVVLARELNIKEIAEIKHEVPNMELEVFVHGAMCMSYSGRCLLGDYMSGRPGNKGECSHSCRFKYNVYLEEERRPGKLMQLGENEGGSYILSSKDLCTINRLSEILPYIDAMKIEGRSKSEFYVGSVVKAYKHMRDSIINKTEIDPQIINLVNNIPHREYWDGFILNDLKDFPEGEVEISSITKVSPGPIITSEYLGTVYPDFVEFNGSKYYKIQPKNDIYVGDKFNILAPDGLLKTEILEILSDKEEQISKGNCNMKYVFVKFSTEMRGWEVVYRN